MDKNKLIADRVINARAQVRIDGVGTITVRALSRMEFLDSQDVANDGARERFVLSRAMVDPVMTEEDVKKWQEGSPGFEINMVANRINELSGLRKGADKSGLPDDGDRPVD